MADRPSDYDLIIIGGGVYGLLIALEATRRRLRPLLLERAAFGGATSANSLRILHGGLRYLQSFDLGRAVVSIRERAWWLERFPELTRPLACLMPLYGDGPRRPALLRAALVMNEGLCRWQGAAVLPAGRVLGAGEVRDLCPAVDPAGLQGGALWYDGFAPDMARLLERVLDDAVRSGAEARDRHEAVGALVGGGQIEGVRVVDRQRGLEFVVRSRRVINAAGPFAPQIAGACGAPAPDLFHPVLAWNVLFDRSPLADCGLAVRGRGPGAQTWFIVPLDGRLAAGTGYAPWRQESDRPSVPEAELTRFIAALNTALPGLELSRHEVVRIDAGLLPAARRGEACLAAQPMIVDHGRSGGPEGLYSVRGVKLTTARDVAARLLDRAAPETRRCAEEPAGGSTR